MLAYINRFLTIATIIRNLYDRYGSVPGDNLRYRTYLIRNMQIFGVLNLLFCMIIMFSGWIAGGKLTFATVLILMMISLRELFISLGAKDLLLADMKEHEKAGQPSN